MRSTDAAIFAAGLQRDVKRSGLWALAIHVSPTLRTFARDRSACETR
jgi:hypothetical protein